MEVITTTEHIHRERDFVILFPVLATCGTRMITYEDPKLVLLARQSAAKRSLEEPSTSGHILMLVRHSGALI